MRRIVLWLASTIAVLVLVFSYHTSTTSRIEAGSSVVAPAGTATTTATTPGGSTVTGPVAQTRWGPVQVRLSISAGKISAVDVVQYPSDNPRDQEINGYALPILTDETISAQDAGIDMVSGATVTSEGYVESLQGALDQAGL